MSAHRQIADSLASLAPWQLLAFSAAASERLASIFRRLGHADGHQVLDAGLETVWAGARGADVRADVERLLETVSSLPEATTDDSAVPAYYAMLALSVLNDALEAARGEALSAARSASEGALNLLSGLDVVLGASLQPRVIDPRNPPPPGPLEETESREQREVLRLLEAASTPTVLVEVRRLAQEAAARLDTILPEVARRRGWAA